MKGTDHTDQAIVAAFTSAIGGAASAVRRRRCGVGGAVAAVRWRRCGGFRGRAGRKDLDGKVALIKNGRLTVKKGTARGVSILKVNTGQP